ncbi:hypothetical protein SLS60_002372 [Paraconiothyrium brasiliense]|uniref:AAA+ ATPase domain-containing protein n=1 Tax=Paraconiothyrium brasiliense TaxID=300254 RepID=A0ABR3S243_9PLEO
MLSHDAWGIDLDDLQCHLAPASRKFMDDEFEDLYQDYVKAHNGADDGDTTRYKTQFEDVTQLSNQYGSLGEVFKTSDKQSRDKGEGGPSDKKFGDVALLLRRMYHWDMNKGEQWTMTLELQSSVLRTAFKEIAKGYTSTSLEQSPIVISEPFSELYFCQERIQEAIKNAESDEVKSELELLETFRKNYMKNTITSLETARNEGLIDASNLWSLFPIGSKILLENKETSGKPLLWCVTVRGCFEEPTDRADQPKIWNVHVEFNSFNGKQYMPVWRTFRIGGFVGARHISFHSKPNRQHDGRIVIDPAGLQQANPEFRDIIAKEDPNSSRFTYSYSSSRDIKTVLLEISSEAGDGDGGRKLSDDDLLTLPATIPGYSLTFKGWGLIDVDDVENIKWKDDIYDMLQMEAEQKEMVRGIIESHHASSSSFDDFIPGKGRGLVFLLHGPPGCGKTLTAESAAETLHRPLYYISGAELGLLETISYRSVPIEDQLELIFKRIARWEAILLFDEAESFVASRDQQGGDGKKNALTSILLRMLEYQSGIIFLTTNRVSDFDTALFSRVHVTLKFEQLSVQHCLFIWKKMAMQTEHDLREEDFEALARIPLDGRTIKNVLRVASLQVRMRLRREGGGEERMMMSDVKKVLRYTVGNLGEGVVRERLGEFYGDGVGGR